MYNAWIIIVPGGFLCVVVMLKNQKHFYINTNVWYYAWCLLQQNSQTPIDGSPSQIACVGSVEKRLLSKGANQDPKMCPKTRWFARRVGGWVYKPTCLSTASVFLFSCLWWCFCVYISVRMSPFTPFLAFWSIISSNDPITWEHLSASHTVLSFRDSNRSVNTEAAAIRWASISTFC